MQSDWILDVLADLRNYALSREMPLLAEHLDDTALIALAEIAACQQRQSDGTNENTKHAGQHIGSAGTGELA